MYNEITCLFGHHQYNEEPTKDKHANFIHLCKICGRSGHWNWGGEGEVWHGYDENGNLIHSKWSDEREIWFSYNEKGNRIHIKWNNGREVWYKYDENGNCIHEKYSDGEEAWRDGRGCWVNKKPKNWKYET